MYGQKHVEQSQAWVCLPVNNHTSILLIEKNCENNRKEIKTSSRIIVSWRLLEESTHTDKNFSVSAFYKHQDLL